MFAALHLLAAESDSGAGGILVVGSAIVVWAVGSALVFQKAGAPAWAGVVPGWHLKYLGRLTGKNPWSLLFFPLYYDAVCELATRFGKSRYFGVGLLMAPFVCYPMLALSDAQYRDQNLISSR
jgi:hypothetical protein